MSLDQSVTDLCLPITFRSFDGMFCGSKSIVSVRMQHFYDAIVGQQRMKENGVIGFVTTAAKPL